MNKTSIYFSSISFILLFILSEIVRRHFYNKKDYSTASAGSIVMAIGIFSLSALPRLPFESVFIDKLIAIELFIIWLNIMASYCICYLKEYFFVVVRQINDQFAVGTWTAGCAVLAIVFMNEFPSSTILIWIITLLASCIWVAYLWVVIKNFWNIIFSHSKSHTGLCLLSTVSTQSIVILMNILFPNYFPKYITQTLILIGVLFYIIGLIIILRYYIKIKFHRIFIRWNNTNCIIHGALSITGLAILLTQPLLDHVIIFIWILATFLLFLVESTSLIKLYQRINIAGLSKGAFAYNISQWSRVFTYGMYYTFSFQLFESNLYQNKLLNLIAHFGQYMMLGILLVEIFIFFRAKFTCSSFMDSSIVK